MSIWTDDLQGMDMVMDTTLILINTYTDTDMETEKDKYTDKIMDTDTANLNIYLQ